MNLIKKEKTQAQTINVLLFKIVFLIFLLIKQTSANVVWYTFPYIRAGQQTMINSISDYGTVFPTTTITYTNAIGNSTSLLHLILSLNSFVLQQANELSFDAVTISISSTVSKVQMFLYQSTVISKLGFQYLIIDSQSNEFDYKSVIWNCNNLANLNGYYRSQNISISVSNFISTDSDGLQYNLYLESISMSNFNGSFFHFQQDLYYNLSHYVITIKTSDQNKVNRVKISIILFRTNTPNLMWYYVGFYYHFLCQNANCFKNFVPVSTYTNPNYISQNRIYYGIRSFNYTKQGQKTYNIDLTQYTNLSINFQLSNNIDFLQLEAFYMAYRGCNDNMNNVSYQVIQNITIANSTIQQNVTKYNVTYLHTYYCPATYTCELQCNISACQYAYTPYLMCFGCHMSCQTCSGSANNSCLSCDSSLNRFKSGSSCICKNGYVDIGTSACVPCGNYMLGCTNCTSRTTCQSCKSGLTLNTLNNPDSCYCTNPSLFLTLNGSCISIDGCLSFLNESNIIKCTQCNTSALYYQINFTCLCQAGTSQVTYSNGVSKYCKIICGNGYVSIQQQCDDGNIINGDGCSSTCKIQNNFACYGELYNTSQCFQDIQLNLTYIGTLRNSISNRAIVYFKVQPFRAALLKIQSNPQLINTTLSEYSSSQFEIAFSQSFTSDFGQLTVSFDYFEDIQGKQFNLLLYLNKSGYFVFPTNESFFTVIQVNSQLVYSTNLDSFLSFAQIGFLILIGLGFLIFLISLFHQKMIGVQLMIMIQMYFFYLMLIDSIPIQLMPIQQILSYSNGYNTLADPDYFRTYQLPKQLIRSGFQKQFIENFNFMFLVLFLSFVLQFFYLIKLKFCNNQVNIIKKKKSYYNTVNEDDSNESILIISKNFIWGRWFLCVGLVFTNQIIFSFLIQGSSIDQSLWNQFRALSNVAAILALLLILIAYLFLFYYIFEDSSTLSPTQAKITRNFQNIEKCYPFIFMTFQIAKILIVGTFYSNAVAIYIVFSLQVFYFVMYLFYRPYRQNTQYQALNKTYNKNGQKINMLNYDDFQNKSANANCSSIHNFHNIFNSLGLILYLILIIIMKKVSKTNQNQELIGKIMIYLCFFHISASELLAILRLIPAKLTRLSEFLRGCLLNCVKNDQSKLQQHNAEEEQRILKQQKQKIRNKDKKLQNQMIKIDTQKEQIRQKSKYNDYNYDRKYKNDTKIKKQKQQSQVGQKYVKKKDKVIKEKEKQKDNENLKMKQKGWLLKQVQDSQILQNQRKKKLERSQRGQQNQIVEKVPKKNKKVKIGKN